MIDLNRSSSTPRRPDEQIMKTIRKHIDKMFEDVAVQKHHYCGWCTKLLGDNDTCSNLACAGQSARSFLQIPLVPNCGEDYKVSSVFTLSIIITWCSYLKTLPVFIDPKLWSAIQQRHTSNGDGIKDIYDENLYTTLCGSGGFLSSTTSLWPIWIVIIHPVMVDTMFSCIAWYVICCYHSL